MHFSLSIVNVTILWKSDGRYMWHECGVWGKHIHFSRKIWRTEVTWKI